MRRHVNRHVNRNSHHRHHQCHAAPVSDSDTDETSGSDADAESPIRCLSCGEEYRARESGTCKECYEEASETKEELKREIEDLKSKIAFLKLTFSASHHSFSDVVLLASDLHGGDAHGPPVPAHRAVLVNRSPVFKAMLENQMEESRSGIIKIGDVSYDALSAFVNYLYTTEAALDEQMGCDLLILAEKYQVSHLKVYCEKFLVSRLNWDNSIVSYALARQHNAKLMLNAALSLITDNMDKLTKQEEYIELVEKDPRLVVEIFEAYLSKQVNTTAPKDSSVKS